MKKAFTLLELLIVIVVIAILASISFRIMGLGSEQEELQKTIIRMQRLENAIGGYFAAFGSYPPVKLHGSRNMYCEVTASGIQQLEDDPDYSVDISEKWSQVEAACRSQPLAMAFPYNDKQRPDAEKILKAISAINQAGGDNNQYKANVQNSWGADALSTPSQLSGKKSETAWINLQMFKFGVMSFLLPRYLIMMDYDKTEIFDEFDQWGDNNTIPCQFENGVPYDSWSEIAEQVYTSSDGQVNREAWKVALLPSQIVTTRWLPNLEKMLCVGDMSGGLEIYGIELGDGDNGEISMASATVIGKILPIYSSGDTQRGANASVSQAYALNVITCRDGWDREFYYYSPPPYQGYRLWSSGKNMKTFPPWVSEKEIDEMPSSAAKTVRTWKSDDVVHMSN